MATPKNISASLRRTFFLHSYLLIIAAWLFTFSFVAENYWTFTSTPKNVQKNFENYLSEREKKFEQLSCDKNSLSILLRKNNDKSQLNITDKNFGLFVFAQNDSGAYNETYWSTFNMSLSGADVADLPNGFYPFKGTNGFFELMKKSVSFNKHEFIVAGLIPIKWNYFIKNKYFTNSFANSSKLDERFYVDSSRKGFPVYNSQKQIVFNLSELKNNPTLSPSIWAALLKVAAIIFILIFLNSIINEITLKKGFYAGAFWLLITVVMLRIISKWCMFPINFQEFELFSPLVYASSILHSSLGDLLINVLLFFWITFFIKYRHNEIPKNTEPSVFIKYKKLWGIACLILFAWFTISAVDIICSFVLDSKIPLNVTDFFHLNAYTFVTFLIITFVILSYYNLSYFLFLPAKRAGIGFWQNMLIVLIAELIIISIHHSPDTISILVAACAWTALYCCILNFRKEDLPNPMVSSAYFLFWLMFYALSITFVIRSIHSKEIEEKIRIADDISLQAGNEGEELLKMAVTNFLGFPYSKNFDRFYSKTDNSYLKDSLVMNNFQGFLNKYESHIYTFDSLQQPLYNNDSTVFSVLNAMVGTLSKSSNIPDLYVYENNGEFNYIYRKKIDNNTTDKPFGYLFMVVKPRTFASSAFPLGLLQQGSLLADDQNQTYSYAIYKNRRLFSNSNDYDFSDSISVVQVPMNEYKETNNKQRKEFWYNAGNNLIVVLTEPNNTFIDTVTLFAYIFLSAAILLVLFKITGFIIQSRFRWKRIKQAFQFKIRFQIHSTIIFISLFSFIVIGISTISFFILRFDKSNRENLTQNLQVVGNELQGSLNTQLPMPMQNPNAMDNYYNDSEMERKVIQIGDLNYVEVNFYDKDGTLKASSQPYIYNKNIVSNKMQPDAYYQMRDKHRINFMQEEIIGKYKYLSGYVPLYDNDKNVFGFLNIPFLHSESELEQEISSFLVTVINLNALIFLLAGAIAGLLTLRITKSFAYIKNEMSKINLGIQNKELDWKRNDELGDLVKEYNIMVSKLNESVKALAQSEREGAWKEMARQVAHEIKNPLTPMKLNLQFLQRAAKNEKEDIHELSQRVPAMLIEQIDQLTRIANDFSQFADIHNTHPELIDLKNKIHNVTMLYGATENVKITFIPSPETNIVYADKKQLNRAFSNIIKNAIEASDEEKMIEIIIKEQHVGDNVVVSIKDNGHGISWEESNKIFIPNFTTKTSGTGLGLAICKGIIERAGGDIWFESKGEEGTTFYVSLPLYKDNTT